MELPWSQRAALSAVVTMLAAAPASAGSPGVSAAECKAMKTPGSPTCDAHLISDPRCSLTGDSGPGWFWPLQPALLLAACLGVLLKRSRQPWRGRPAEKRAVLALDLAKQAVASLLVQISTIVAAEKFHELEVDIEVDMHGAHCTSSPSSLRPGVALLATVGDASLATVRRKKLLPVSWIAPFAFP